MGMFRLSNIDILYEKQLTVCLHREGVPMYLMDKPHKTDTCIFIQLPSQCGHILYIVLQQIN